MLLETLAARRHSLYRRALSPLMRRILAVNVMALLILLSGFLYLGRYKDQLVAAELAALSSEARLVATTLGEAALVPRVNSDEDWELAAEMARPIVRRLVKATDTRTRLFDSTGDLMVDSRILRGTGGDIQVEELPPLPSQNRLIRTFQTMTFSFPFSGKNDYPLYKETPLQQADHYPDVVQALAGETAASAWTTDKKGLLFTASAPIQRYKYVLGAVFLSRSGQDIDAAVRAVRYDIMRIFLVALAVTVILSGYLAQSIVRPIRRLALAAERVRRGGTRSADIPDFSKRRDEIGELSVALREMTAALGARMDAIERFAADVSHELKNPLSSLRSAVETVGKISDEERRKRLMDIIQHDVKRLDRLITDISGASRLDAELSRAEAEPVDVANLMQMLHDIHQATDAEGPVLTLSMPPQTTLLVSGVETRLVQVIQNLISNAISFSPKGGSVRLAARPLGDQLEITVEDDGPGIPEGKCQAIFDRFYTERPAGESFGTHSGLGLSISKQIVEAHAGTITAENVVGDDGKVKGARFRVLLPLLSVVNN